MGGRTRVSDEEQTEIGVRLTGSRNMPTHYGLMIDHLWEILAKKWDKFVDKVERTRFSSMEIMTQMRELFRRASMLNFYNKILLELEPLKTCKGLTLEFISIVDIVKDDDYPQSMQFYLGGTAKQLNKAFGTPADACRKKVHQDPKFQ